MSGQERKNGTATTLFKDTVLSSISETPLPQVDVRKVERCQRFSHSAAAHVVTFGLEPVRWLLSTLVALGNIARAPKRMNMRSKEREGLGRYLLGTPGFTTRVLKVTVYHKSFMYTMSRISEVPNVTPESLGRTAIHRMDPMPGADVVSLGDKEA